MLKGLIINMNMKQLLKLGLSSLVLTFVTFHSAVAQQHIDTPLGPGFYVGGVARGDFIEDTHVKQLGPVSGGTVSFDPGAGMSIKGGYRFCPWFSLEGEVGFHGNSISSLTGASVDAVLWQIPEMANFVITLPTHSPLTLQFGAGVGGTTSILDVDHIVQGSTLVVGTEDQTTFAWQAFTGLEYYLNPQLSVGLSYNFRWVDGPRWDHGNFPVEFDSMHNHSAGISVTYRF